MHIYIYTYIYIYIERERYYHIIVYHTLECSYHTSYITPEGGWAHHARQRPPAEADDH